MNSLSKVAGTEGPSSAAKNYIIAFNYMMTPPIYLIKQLAHLDLTFAQRAPPIKSG